MTLTEYCKEHGMTQSAAAEISERNSMQYKRAYASFCRPAYYGTVLEVAEVEHDGTS